MCIKDDKGEIIGIGRAKKKIDAEQLASKEALINLGVLDVEL
jgi:dsRNA-specific ribonuclease